MKVQQPVGVGESTATVRWYRKYWPIIIMFMILGLNWIPWLFGRPTTYKEWMESRKSMEQVFHRTFVNEVLEVDGKNIHDCQFINATLIYRGKQPFYWSHNSIAGRITVQVTDGPQQGGFAIRELVGQSEPCKSGEIICDFVPVTPDGEPMAPYW